eukprot:scaffold1227_cov111-Isochrysis_galbana.AAC.1
MNEPLSPPMRREEATSRRLRSLQFYPECPSSETGSPKGRGVAPDGPYRREPPKRRGPLPLAL